MQSDLAIANSVQPKPIVEIAAALGLEPGDIRPYGHDKAKIRLDAAADRPANGKLILVSAITPTPAGEGKTTVTVGLGQALGRIGKKAIVAIREPSLGPVMGIKGGAAGGGRAQVIPMTDINLHFTGDLHAITAAHNTLAAMVDNALHFKQGTLDARRVSWRRALDVSDRSLRSVLTGLGGPTQGIPRETGFDITAASEVMAVLCMARDRDDLRARLGRIIVGQTADRTPVTARDVGADGAMAALLADALEPNLVQTLEGTPALVHGGPFANIAHGTSSIVATNMALRLADYVVTEAGFGFDLGAEKFFNIVSPAGGFGPSAVVLVATIRALKLHGGAALTELSQPDPEAVRRGLGNLDAHLASAKAFGVPTVVAINRFVTDTQDEIDVVLDHCRGQTCHTELVNVWEKGGEGGEALARKITALADGFTGRYQTLYTPEMSTQEKIRAVAKTVYGAKEVDFTRKAELAIKRAARQGFGRLPVCIAKTQKSLSDDPKALCRPRDFTVTVRDVLVNAGAGFLVPLTGSIMRMPGLPRRPAALDLGVDDSGRVTGVN
jgi:formate--tetrahydrofolate ligase